MSFNIEWGGTHISFENVVEVIRQSDVDIVGIQEAEGNLQRLASELGWHYDAQSYSISRFPIFAAPHANYRYVLVEVQPGKVIAFANVHLPSDPYGPDLVRDGRSVEDIMELEESVRLEPLLPYLDALRPVLANNVPVIMAGDFNAPSHRDWTEDMVGSRPFLRYPVDWPVSRAVEATGFEDSWRVAHPDPRTKPGLTWWANRPPLELYSPGENDPQDRIDFIWSAGAADVVSSELVGEKAVSPWPSDHRAVVSTFSVVPAAMPQLIDAGKRTYDESEDIIITYRRALNATIEISDYADQFVSGDGELRISASELGIGHYEVRLDSPNAETISTEFWIVDDDARPVVSVAHGSYKVGDPIRISWQGGPANRNDYIGIYPHGATSEYSEDLDGGLTWLYVNARPSGSTLVDASTAEATWPLPPGTYVARLMKDDGYDVIAESAAFTIR